MYKISVLIVDDDSDWLKAMKMFLGNEDDIIVTATVDSVEGARNVIINEKVDVVLLDINLTGSNYDGIYAAAEISMSSKFKIIMLTSFKEDEFILKSFSAGAVNYIFKADYTKIPEAIRSAYNNSSAFEVLLREYSRLKEEEQIKNLTPSEKEILMLAEQGYTQSQMQKLLFKSESTLKKHINSFLKKLQVKNTKEAIKKVKMKGLSHEGLEKEKGSTNSWGP